jgi:hypothetical protein
MIKRRGDGMVVFDEGDGSEAVFKKVASSVM